MEISDATVGAPTPPAVIPASDAPLPAGSGIELFAPRTTTSGVEDVNLILDTVPQVTSDELLLDLTHNFSPFNVPTLEEIISQVQRHRSI